MTEPNATEYPIITIELIEQTVAELHAKGSTALAATWTAIRDEIRRGQADYMNPGEFGFLEDVAAQYALVDMCHP